MSKFLQPGFNNIEIFSRVSSSFVYETEVNAACGETFFMFILMVSKSKSFAVTKMANVYKFRDVHN